VSGPASANSRGSTFSVHSPVQVVASNPSFGTSLRTGDDLLPILISGERGKALRAQLVSRYPDLAADEIDDAIQYACRCFLDEAEGITSPGQVYAWLRTAAHRSLGHEAKRHRREIAVDPRGEEAIGQHAADDGGPAQELIELEDDADLEMLVSEVASSLSERKRDVLALYGAGYRRPQIAERLGLRERVVKRELLEIMNEARATLVRLVGGGCRRGEPLVMRLAFGTATPDESDAAREHLAHCGRCQLFNERLIAWREKAGAMLPAPVAEGASPGVVRQITDAAGEKLSSLKQQVLDGGAQLKQHAAATSSRMVDPTPIAGARPGTAAAVIASCVAIGGGAAACVEQGADPLGAAKGLIASAPEEKSPEEPTQPPPEAESTGPTYTPVETPVEEEPAVPAPEPSPQPTPEPQPKPEPKAEPAPEESFEPASTSSQSTETESESSYEPTEAAPAPEPNPAPASSGSQFGGP
jgi:RNA polymerase sigma factor (sigma-70 family)